MIKGKVEFRWGEINLDTDEPIESCWTEFEFPKEDLELDDHEFMERWVKPMVAAAFHGMKDKVLGPNWFMKALGKKHKIKALMK